MRRHIGNLLVRPEKRPLSQNTANETNTYLSTNAFSELKQV